MRIVLDPSFDLGGWPGPLGSQQAAAGVEWVGFGGLLSLLEVRLGLAGPVAPRAARIAALVPAVRSTAGFWAASGEVDPVGTAGRLLEWRDALWMAGWQGEALTDWLGQLAEVTRDAAVGFPDRLAGVAEAIEQRSVDIEQVEVLAPVDDFTSLWKVVLDRLAGRGVRVETVELAPALATGTLALVRDAVAAGRARSIGGGGDGSVVLLRPYGRLQAAEDVAAWLASLHETRDVVIIGRDPILDRALSRFGLPALGARLSPEDNSLLQVLPLVIDMGWKPQDPRRAFELLNLSASPVPRKVAGKLAKALQDWPAVGGLAWRAALEPGSAEAIEPIFHARVARDSAYPLAEIRRRIAIVESWIEDRWKGAAVEQQRWWEAASGQCQALRVLLEQVGLEAVTGPQLDRLLELASGGDSGVVLFPASAGLTCVGDPGAVAGPARHVVWWDFTAEGAPAPPRLPLFRRERDALAEAGIQLVDPGVQARALAERWRRPLFQAAETLVLVSPAHGADGEPLHPHPLWDEISSVIEQPSDVISRILAAPREPRALRELPGPRREWRVRSGRVAMRKTESPSSVGDFLGCPFRWSVKHVGRIRPDAPALPDRRRLLGNVVHEILQHVLSAEIDSAAAARSLAERQFDERLPELAATLLLPGADADRARTREITARSAEVLWDLAARAGGVLAVEQTFETAALGAQFQGRPDLVVGPPAGVVDLKWGGYGYRTNELKSGTNYQLASYAFLVRSMHGGAFPPVAYFIVESQRLLTTGDNPFPGAQSFGRTAPERTWEALEAAHADRAREVSDGIVLAPGNPDDSGRVLPVESSIDAETGRLVLSAPCHFCEYPVLCGKAP